MDPDRVIIFDTTLRDGEQSPGISLNTTRSWRSRISWRGSASTSSRRASRSPRRATSRRCGRSPARCTGPSSPGLARAQAPDIERAADAVRDAERPRIHTFISTSDIHIEHQLQSTREDVKGRRGPRWRTRSRSSTTSSSRRWTRPAPTSSSPPRWCRSRSTRARRRSTSPTPSATPRPTSTRRSWAGSTTWCPALRDVVLSVHCHDDLGLAVANSLAGVQAGARQVECAINGIGERAGNASLEEIVMLLHTRADATWASRPA